MHLPHWSFTEMHAAFGFTFEQFLYFGGYPGAASLAEDPERWRRYLLDARIETTIARDVLLLTRVDKPALLRRLFDLGCRYSGQVLSYTKTLGQLHDAGNTTTLAHYLDLLAAFGQYQTAGKAEIEKELAKVIAGIEAAGMEPRAVAQGGRPARPAQEQRRGHRRAGDRGLRPSVQLLPPLLRRGRLPRQARLQAGRLLHPLRRRGGSHAPLGQQGPELHQVI
jgi:hypothetical protein